MPLTAGTAAPKPRSAAALPPAPPALTAYRELQHALDAAMPDQIIRLDGKPFRKKGYWRAVSVAFHLTVEPVEEGRELRRHVRLRRLSRVNPTPGRSPQGPASRALPTVHEPSAATRMTECPASLPPSFSRLATLHSSG